MLPVFSVLGGAALVELGKRIAHKGGDGDAKQNKQREQKLRIFLEGVKKELEQEKELRKQDAARLEALAQEQASLKSQNTLLMVENVILNDKRSKLAKQTFELKQEVEQLRVEVAEGPKALRDEVSSIFSAFLANTMSEEEAVRRMVGLGCEIQLVDRSELMKSAGDEAGSELAAANMGTDPLKTRLVLDNPARLQRLVAACRTTAGDQPAGSHQVALLTFRDSSKMDHAALRLTQGSLDPSLPNMPEAVPATIKRLMDKIGVLELGSDAAGSRDQGAPRGTKEPSAVERLAFSPPSKTKKSGRWVLKAPADAESRKQPAGLTPLIGDDDDLGRSRRSGSPLLIKQ